MHCRTVILPSAKIWKKSDGTRQTQCSAAKCSQRYSAMLIAVQLTIAGQYGADDLCSENSDRDGIIDA